MSTEFEALKCEMSEIKVCLKELTQTVNESMRQQSVAIGVLQQWQSEVNNKLCKGEAERTELRGDINRIAVKQESIIQKQETSFKRIDEVRNENKTDESRLKTIENTLSEQKGAAKTIVFWSSIAGIVLALLSLYATFKG